MAQDCRAPAAAPPVLTYGGPNTVPPGDDEAALGAAFGGNLYDCAHMESTGWFARWRHGLTDRMDVGADLEVLQRNDKGDATAKIELRYRLADRVRLEAGFGGADDSTGKSLNVEAGATFGRPEERRYARYASVRVAAAHGFPGNVCCFGGDSGSVVGGYNVPPANYLLVGAIGTTARISDNARFVYEAGFGGLLTHFSDRTETAKVFYMSAGLRFNIYH